MSKMHYFSNKFLKLAKRWGLSAIAPLNLQYWWLEVPWFDQIVVFEADYDEIELENIVMTSFQWRHHHSSSRNVTNITSQIFSNFISSQLKFLAALVVLG